jgi:hypothetical protein
MQFRLRSMFLVTTGVAIVAFAFTLGTAEGPVALIVFTSILGSIFARGRLLSSAALGAAGGMVGLWTFLLYLILRIDFSANSRWFTYYFCLQVTLTTAALGLLTGFCVWQLRRTDWKRPDTRGHFKTVPRR